MNPAPHPAPDAGDVVAFLTNRDAPCPRCNYNLRGNTSAECPECACRLTVGIREDQPSARSIMLPATVAAFALAVSGLLHVTQEAAFSLGLVTLGMNRFQQAVYIVGSFVNYAGTLAWIAVGVLGLLAVKRKKVVPRTLWTACWITVSYATISVLYTFGFLF